MRALDRTTVPDKGSFEHPALLHADTEQFLSYMVPFVREGIARGEPVFVAVGRENLDALRGQIGNDGAAAVSYNDTREWHPHTGSRLRAFHEVVTSELAMGASRLRLVGEPVWPQEAGPVREWQRYESVLNAVLAPFPVTLVCTYDTGRLDPSITQTARRTHPKFHEGTTRSSDVYLGPEQFLRQWTPDFDTPPAGDVLHPEIRNLGAMRRLVRQLAGKIGLDERRSLDASLAATEVVANALEHGGSPVTFRAWIGDDDALVCQTEDTGGGIGDPFAGYFPPDVMGERGRGLWLVRQLVDLLQVQPGPGGTIVRFTMVPDR
jgi:anti-sigma regulatory factor (Ser/Thr protein kinase)